MHGCTVRMKGLPETEQNLKISPGKWCSAKLWKVLHYSSASSLALPWKGFTKAACPQLLQSCCSLASLLNPLEAPSSSSRSLTRLSVTQSISARWAVLPLHLPENHTASLEWSISDRWIVSSSPRLNGKTIHWLRQLSNFQTSLTTQSLPEHMYIRPPLDFYLNVAQKPEVTTTLH